MKRNLKYWPKQNCSRDCNTAGGMIKPLATFQHPNMSRQHHSQHSHLSQPLSELKIVDENHRCCNSSRNKKWKIIISLSCIDTVDSLDLRDSLNNYDGNFLLKITNIINTILLKFYFNYKFNQTSKQAVYYQHSGCLQNSR